MSTEKNKSAYYDTTARDPSTINNRPGAEYKTPTASARCNSAGHPQKELAEFNYYWRCIDDIYHDLARKLGLSDSALSILYSLHTLGDGSLQRDIYQQAPASKQTIHSSIHNLERDGYLWLEAGGRGRRIWLTEKGRKLIHDKIVPIVALENAAFTALGPEKSREFLQLNAEFVRILRKLADESITENSYPKAERSNL